jgi:predicted nuclease of predicted toxin-antitoxin system
LYRFFLDENIPRRIAERLRAEGHDVVEVVAGPLRGKPDDYLWRRAATEGRVFVTRDIGATALPIRPAPASIILLRGPETLTAVQLDAMFGAFWDRVERADLAGHLVSVRPGGYRLHRIRV